MTNQATFSLRGRNPDVRTYPRLQIITLAELFQGKKPDIPYVDKASVKRAKREETGKQERLI